MAKVMVVGSGVVGQATGKGLIKKGHEVVFVDISKKIIRGLSKEGFKAYLPNELIGVAAKISMVCVSTPRRNDGGINLEHLTSAVANLGKWLKQREKERGDWHLVVIRSTVPPGTTRQIVLPILEEHSGMVAGKDFGLCMNPEFLRAKSAEEDFLHPRAIVIGELDQLSGAVLMELYNSFGGQTFRVNLETAEFVKCVHNLFNATKISFFNEMRHVANSLGGIDASVAFQVVAHSAEGMWNPSYGIRDLGPFTGTCLPKDTAVFLSFAKEQGIDVPLSEATILVNEEMKRRKRKGG